MKLKQINGKWVVAKKEEDHEEKEESSTVNDCIGYLVCYLGALQYAHWLADTKTNEHAALGDLYHTLQGLVDDIVELYSGKYTLIAMPKALTIVSVGKKPCATGEELVDDLKEHFVAGKDDDLLNITADMCAAIYKAKYLLKEG